MKIKTKLTMAFVLGSFWVSSGALAEGCPTDHCTKLGSAVDGTCKQLKDLTGKPMSELSAPFVAENKASCFCPCSCWAEGMTVSTVEGETPMEGLEPWMSLRTPYGAVKARSVFFSSVKNASAIRLRFSNGQSLLVSDNHPFVLEGGIVSDAKSLSVGSRILGESVDVVIVTSSQEEPYTGRLHNFILDGNSLGGEARIVFSGGVQSADWRVQSYRDRMAGAVALRQVIAGTRD